MILNENTYLLTSLMWVCKLVNDKVRTRLPIRKRLLTLLVKSIDSHFADNPQTYLSILYRALFLTAYYGLFRIGELTKSDHTVKVADVHIGENKNKLVFILHMSKTHGKNNKPQIIRISSVSKHGGPGNGNRIPGINCSYCPFQALREYVDVRKKFCEGSEQFFVFKDRSPVEPRHARLMLKKLLLLYNFHCIRMGMASDLLEIHYCSVETIRKIGRWKSTAVYTYLRM